MRRDNGAPSNLAASIRCTARSDKAVRASKYTYGYSAAVNTSTAPPRLRTSGSKRPCSPKAERSPLCSGPPYCKKSV